MIGTGLGRTGYGFARPARRARPEIRHDPLEMALRAHISNDGRPITIDANVAIGAGEAYPCAYAGTVRKVNIAGRYQDRLVIPSAAGGEIYSDVRSGKYRGVFRKAWGIYSSAKRDDGCLEGLVKMHSGAASDTAANEGLRWRRAKRTYLQGHGFPNGGMGDEARGRLTCSTRRRTRTG